MLEAPQEYRILVVEDTVEVQRDYRRILEKKRFDLTAGFRSILFGAPKLTVESTAVPHFMVDVAGQGKLALEMVKASLVSDPPAPYALAFVDMRMPPGWDGVETVVELWKVYPDLEVAFVTAHSDYSLDQIVAKLPYTNRFLFLKKPFDPTVIMQTAKVLAEKWWQRRKSEALTDELQQTIAALEALEAPRSSGPLDIARKLQEAKRGLQQTTAELRALSGRR